MCSLDSESCLNNTSIGDRAWDRFEIPAGAFFVVNQHQVKSLGCP